MRHPLVGLGILAFALAGAPIHAQEPAPANTTRLVAPVVGSTGDVLLQRSSSVRLGFETVQLPAGETIGLVGTTYLVTLGAGMSAGPAVYGALSGRRGGLFTLGGEVAWEHALAGPVSLGVGLFAGGGGGGSAPVGGGFMLRPHAGLRWDLGGVSAGLSYALVRFGDGVIDGQQLGVSVHVPTAFRYVSIEHLDALVASPERGGLGFDRVHATAGAYRPLGGARRASGGALTSTIGLVGVRGEQSLGGGAFWGIEGAGAATGGVTGYAEYLATIGTRYALAADRVGVGMRLSLGMGGGGDVDVGGGLLVRGAAEATCRVTHNFALAIEGGIAAAPQASFKAGYGSLALRWTLDDAAPDAVAASSVRTEWSGGVEQYAAARKDGSTRELRAVVLRVNRFIAPLAYLTGQARSAAGGGAGGYTAGLVGAGAQGTLGGNWMASAELLVGAAGGGGVDTGNGIITQPMAYLGYQWPGGIAMRLGAGRIAAVSGALNGTVLEASLGFAFGVPSRGAR